MQQTLGTLRSSTTFTKWRLFVKAIPSIFKRLPVRSMAVLKFIHLVSIQSQRKQENFWVVSLIVEVTFFFFYLLWTQVANIVFKDGEDVDLRDENGERRPRRRVGIDACFSVWYNRTNGVFQLDSSFRKHVSKRLFIYCREKVWFGF
jgi:hypothetical protein